MKAEADADDAAMVGDDAVMVGDDAVMVGDTTRDVRAAESANVPTIAVRTGRFGEDGLKDSGAAAVLKSVAALLHELDDT